MKYTITHTAEWVLITILALLCIYTAYKSYTLKGKVEYITDTVTDTIVMTNVEYDTVFFSHITLDTLTLTDTNFIYDTITNTIYAQVEVPIFTHIIDTNIDTNIHLYESISGYKVNLDSMALEVKPVIIKPQKKFRVMPAIGVGYGTGGVGIFGGIGVSYW